MTIKEQAQHILSQLTLEEKVALQVGKNNWHTYDVDRINLESIMMSDGPHGLRKQPNAGDNLGMGYSNPAVCFPTASKLACSWDRKVLALVGNALAEQCQSEDVAIILGPGINIKRNSLCGRNFEYFSEDPYITGELATSYVQAVQKNNVGVSLKHFAGNNSEYARMVADSCIDERALHEIYLSAFEKVITSAQPWTVMCGYNRLNGQYCSENDTLLNKILRDKWHFEGAVISDWGAVNDRPLGIQCGLDLQMPTNDYESVLAALQSGRLTEQQLDVAVLRILQLVIKSRQRVHKNINYETQHNLAGKVSAQCTVLAKNSCAMLPLKSEEKIAVIGQLALKPHFQGGGSSKVNATQITSIVDALKWAKVDFAYADGYPLDTTVADQSMIDNAVEIAQHADKVILVVGLPDICEYEGFDRTSLDMPDSIMQLIDAVTRANGNCIAVVQSGSPVDMSWDNSVKAIVLDYMPGQNGGTALVDLLYGKCNFSGRLAETWPISHDIQSSTANFANDQNRVLYAESIFVGYRYYDFVPQYIKYPFGYGLSYTHFKWKNAKLSDKTIKNTGKVTLTVDITNNGSCDGSEVVQVYVTSCNNKYPTPIKELKAFEKVSVKKGVTTTVKINLNSKSFRYYNAQRGEYVVDGGKYIVHVARNSQEILFSLPLTIEGDNTSVDMRQTLPVYYNIGENWQVDNDSFALLYDKPLPDYTRTKKQLHTVNSTFADIKDRYWGRRMRNLALSIAGKMGKKDAEMALMIAKSLDCSPLRILCMQEGISIGVVEGIVDVINGHFFGGVSKALKYHRINKKRIAKLKKLQAKQARGKQ